MNIRRIGRIVVLVAVAMLAVGCLAGRYMTNFALRPEEHGQKFDEDRAKMEKRFPGLMAWFDDLHEAGVFKDTVIVGEGDFRLHAVYAPAADPANAQGTAIVVHGYTDNHLVFMNLGRMYRDSLNFNILLPDLHYHGESEGRAIQMGWLDRLDVKRWCKTAHDIWGDDLMLVHGVSMGAATTMMLSGEEDLPEYVRGFVEDCGYASVWAQFYKQLKEMHLPVPILKSANIVTRHKYGWDFKEASSLDKLAVCERPVLFIHGDGDDFVLTSNVYECYAAKTHGYRDIWVVHNTPEHAFAYHDHPAAYTQKVREFVDVVKNDNKNDIQMKTINVPRVTGFDQIEKFAKGEINIVDWPEEYPYAPEATFAIAHNGEKVLIRFEVKEDNIRAVTTEANGPVWEDSCVEFFVKDPQSPYYYNFETNCIGVGLAARHLTRNEGEDLTPEEMALVGRRSSLECKPVDITEGGSWSLELEVPFALITADGSMPRSLRANFYKCGDKTAVTHFLSWNKVDVPSPDFHRPEFFGTLLFE